MKSKAKHITVIPRIGNANSRGIHAGFMARLQGAWRRMDRLRIFLSANSGDDGGGENKKYKRKEGHRKVLIKQYVTTQKQGIPPPPPKTGERKEGYEEKRYETVGYRV